MLSMSLHPTALTGLFKNPHCGWQLYPTNGFYYDYFSSASGVRFYEGLTPISGRADYQAVANFMEDHCKYLPRSPAGPEALG